MNSPFPYQYICIEGNIGSGKTSFCNLLEKRYKMELILEQFSDNPFLPHFYENPSRYALPVELFFMTERYKQLTDRLSSGHLFNTSYLADYFFDKTRLFARNNLNEMEFKLFQQIYETLAPNIITPEIVLYIHRPVEQLKEHIKKRGRRIEQHISSQYLRNIQDVYFDYFRMDLAYPVVIVNAENLHYTESEDDLAKLIGIVQKEYTKGVHRVSFVH